MICGIRPTEDDGTPARLRHPDHGERRLPHPRQTHLAQIIKVVFKNDCVFGFVVIKRTRPLVFRFGKHGVEQRDAIPFASRIASGIQRAKRRVGLHRFPKFGVKAEIVGLGE